MLPFTTPPDHHVLNSIVVEIAGGEHVDLRRRDRSIFLAAEGAVVVARQHDNFADSHLVEGPNQCVLFRRSSQVGWHDLVGHSADGDAVWRLKCAIAIPGKEQQGITIGGEQIRDVIAGEIRGSEYREAVGIRRLVCSCKSAVAAPQQVVGVSTSSGFGRYQVGIDNAGDNVEVAVSVNVGDTQIRRLVGRRIAGPGSKSSVAIAVID